MEAVTATAEAEGPVGRYRWVICALLFFATTINYIDRQVLGILAPDLQKSIGWTEIEYGYIVTAFQAAYALGLLVTGRLARPRGHAPRLRDRDHRMERRRHVPRGGGHRPGLRDRPLLPGPGRGRQLPGLHQDHRGMVPEEGAGLRHRDLQRGDERGGDRRAGGRALHRPHLVGWPWAFILTGAIGFVWLVVWWVVYRPPESHPRLSKAEFAYIRSDAEEAVTPIPWLKLMGYRQTWAFAIGKFMTDPIWWFYLFWLGKFLNEKHGLSLAKLGPPIIAIYLIADVGSIGGGWLSSFLIKRGWSINAARKSTMLFCALCVMPIVFATQVTSLWAAVGLIGLAAAAHQGWSANLFTLASDMFPRRAVGSVVGFGGMAGAVGGMFIATAVGHLLQVDGQLRAGLPAGGGDLPPGPAGHPDPGPAPHPAQPRRGLNVKTFLDDDFLLESDVAADLYHRVARDLPIIDYHCHLSPEQIASAIASARSPTPRAPVHSACYKRRLRPPVDSQDSLRAPCVWRMGTEMPHRGRQCG